MGAIFKAIRFETTVVKLYQFKLKNVVSKWACGHEYHFEVEVCSYVRTFVRNKNMPCCFDSFYGRRDKAGREVSEYTSFEKCGSILSCC